MQPPRREKTPKQNRALNWMLEESGLFDDDARDYLETVCGKRYRREMDFYDYKKAIGNLEDKTALLTGGRQHTPAAPRATVEREPLSKNDPATLEQLTLIREMLEGMGADYKMRGDWIRRQVKYPFPRTVGEAQKLIEALKKMQGRDYHFPPRDKSQDKGKRVKCRK